MILEIAKEIINKKLEETNKEYENSLRMNRHEEALRIKERIDVINSLINDMDKECEIKSKRITEKSYSNRKKDIRKVT